MLDFLRILGALGIISIHGAEQFWKMDYEENKDIFSAMIALSMWGGPFLSVYMILSGFFILDEAPNFSKTFARIKHLVVLYVTVKYVY